MTADNNMLRVGTVLHGTYRIDKALASGGFGNTYLATNIEFEERVAVKEFYMKGVNQREDDQTTVSVSNRENTEQFEEQREKFKKEARRLRQLSNEHLVRVHDLFEENGTAYYVMDFVDGETLSERLKRTGKPLDEAEVWKLLPQILDALKAVHHKNIWHLDLKPGNIMLDRQGMVKLIDFGASKQLNVQKGGATSSTAVSYTLGFAPLEQTDQNYRQFGPWTDLYALGATLYNLLTAKIPPTSSAILTNSEALILPDYVSGKMKRLILWLMQPNHTQRPQSVEDVERELSMQHHAQGEETLYTKNDRTRTRQSEKTEFVHPNPSRQQYTTTASAKQEPKRKKSSGIWWGIGIFLLIIIGVATAIFVNYGVDTYRAAVTDTYSDEGNYDSQETNSSESAGSNTSSTGQTRQVPAGYVDLGLPSGTLWKDHNEPGFYTFDRAVQQFGKKLPSKAQWEELINSCKWQWSDSGCKITGPNGKHIFLPAAGYRDCDGSVNDDGWGCYWSSTPFGSDGAWLLDYGEATEITIGETIRCQGGSVRLVN